MKMIPVVVFSFVVLSCCAHCDELPDSSFHKSASQPDFFASPDVPGAENFNIPYSASDPGLPFPSQVGANPPSRPRKLESPKLNEIAKHRRPACPDLRKNLFAKTQKESSRYANEEPEGVAK
jgi:hypothetical protein